MNPERFARIQRMLAMRQPDLTVCLEEVHKPHNLAAMIRTCDAVGVHDVHAVWPEKMRMNNHAAKGSHYWVKINRHETLTDALAALRQQGMQLLATHLSDRAVDFRDIDYTRPTAILFGAEKHGISQEALAQADQEIIIPMVGMAQSLNVSVASALILYEAQRQRQLAGFYQQECRLPQAEQDRLLFERGYPVLARVCKMKHLPYPAITPEGEVEADEAWWQQMQMSHSAWKALEHQALEEEHEA
ncbi:MAG: tRNA (guanosine(18)-2'-O)-methyltransferase TrmH [Aeromonadaceae bacterium]